MAGRALYLRRVASEDGDLSKYRRGATVAEMPIRLEAAQVANLASANRNVFVLCNEADDPSGVTDLLSSMAGVTVLPGADLFANGMFLVLNNYVAGMHVGYAMSSLAESDTFLLAARDLADAIYRAARTAAAADVVVDASPGNATQARAIAALYPDALFVFFGDARGPLSEERWSDLDVVHIHGDPDDDLRRAPWWSRGRAPAVAALPEPVAELPGRPIFVVGCARSGTTWLQTMLAAHPAIGGPKEESAIFAALRDLVNNRALEAWMPRGDRIAAIRRFVLTLFGHCLATQAPTATRLSEKTPHHALHLDTIALVLPEAMIVGIYRDGRDVVRSLLEVPFGTDSATLAASGWLRSTVATSEFAATFPSYRDVRYEEANAQPVESIAELLRWLGLPPDDAVLDELTRRAGARVSQHAARFEGGGKGLRPADLRAVYRVAGAQLAALGYVTEDELRRVKRRPSYVFDRGVRGMRKVARRLVRNR